MKIIKFLLILSILSAPVNYLRAELDGRISLGYVERSGNTQDQTANFSFNLENEPREKLSMQYNGNLTYAKSAGVTNSDRRNLRVTSEFIRDTNNSYYLRSGYLKDRFAGYDQRLTLGLGYLRALINEKNASLRARLGIDVTRDKLTDRTTDSMEWLKIGLIGSRKINENLRIRSEFDFDAPKDDYKNNYQIESVVGSILTVTDKIDFELSYKQSYRKTVAVEGKRRKDSTIMASIVYSL